MLKLFENTPYTFSYLIKNLCDLPLGIKIKSDKGDLYELKEQIENIGKVRKFSRINNTKLRFMTYNNIQNNFYLVKEKLLTEEEKEFLKDICKYFNNIKYIEFNDESIFFYSSADFTIASIDYPNNIEFNNIELLKHYTLKELGLEE